MTEWNVETALNHHAACSVYDDGACTCGLRARREQIERSPLAPGEGTWSVFAQKVVEQRDALKEVVQTLKARLVDAEQKLIDAECERDASRGMEKAAEMRAERLYKERERLTKCNDAMREPMRKLREALDMPAQGEGYVIDYAIHCCNTLGEERDEALRLLATRVEAKRLDEAQEEIARLRAACTLALRIMEQPNRVTVPPFAKFINVDFAPEDVAVLRAALEKKS